MPIYKKINKDFFKVWSHDMAYVLGFFAADGTVTHSKRGTSFWAIQITDKKLLFTIREILGSEHAIHVRTRFGNENTLYRLQVGSKEMVEDLARLGFHAKKANTIEIPKMHTEYMPDFIRGYFDGDGNVWAGDMNKQREKSTKTLLVSFTSNSENFLISLHVYLKDLGIKGGSIRVIKNKKSFRLTLSTLDSLKIFKIMYTRETPLQLLRKKVVFERYIQKMRS